MIPEEMIIEEPLDTTSHDNPNIDDNTMREESWSSVEQRREQQKKRHDEMMEML